MEYYSTNLNLEFCLDRAGFKIITPQLRIIEVSFYDAPTDFMVGVAHDALSVMAKDGITATCFKNQEQITICFKRNSVIPVSLHMGLSGITNLSHSNYLYQANLEEEVLQWSFENIEMITSDANNWNLILTAQESRISFYYPDVEVAALSVEEVVFTPFAVHPYTDDGQVYVPAGNRPPEFSVGVYDDAAYLRPRPLAVGVPVISTVPTQGSGLALDDTFYLENGIATPSRIMYFKVVADQLLSNQVKVYLQISLPNGLDTIADPVYVLLNHDADTLGQSIYKGSYTFHKEDTINYVDGFAYLGVYISMKIQNALAMQLQVSSVGPYSTSYITAEEVIESMGFVP